jgi:EpsD family peptidyl-prolyl cis-trans isomerase
MKRMLLQISMLGAGALLCFVPAACGGGHKLPAGQVAARVNGHEISLHQLQYLLQRQSPYGAGPTDPRRRALEALVEQELAAQAALEEGIESDPDFVQGMEIAKRELLARMYQERLASIATRPAADEVDRYYDAHPALFAQRRIYTLQESLVDAGRERMEAVQATVNGTRSLVELDKVLDQASVRHRSHTVVQVAEAVPLVLLERLVSLEPGRSMWVPGTAAPARIWTLVRAEESPVSRQEARASIEAYLWAERKREAVLGRMRELRRTAKVEVAASFQPVASAPSGP